MADAAVNKAHALPVVRAGHHHDSIDSTTVVRRVVDRASVTAALRGDKSRTLEIRVDERGRLTEGDVVHRLVKGLISSDAKKGNEDDLVDEIFLLGSANLTLNYSSLLSAETIDNLELRRTHTLHRDVLMTLLEDEDKTNVTHATKLAFSWVPGAVLCGFGSTLSGVGIVLQKYSHVLAMRTGEVQISEYYYFQRWWLVGFITWLVAEVVSLVAMGVVPQVVVSCMKSWTVTSTIFMSKQILGEELNCRGCIAIGGLITGAGLIASFAPMAPPQHADDMKHWQARLTSRYFMYGVLAFAAVFVATMSVIPRYFAAARASTASPSKLAPFCWAGVAALCTGVALTLFRCVVMLTFAGTPLVTIGYVPEDWSIPALVFASLVFGVLEVHSLNLSLAIGDAVLVLPIYLCLGMVARMFFTAILLDELGSFKTWAQAAMFWFGVGLSIASLYPLTQMKVSLNSLQLKGRLSVQNDNLDISK